MKKYSSVFIILAGTMWGLMGVFVRLMESIGFNQYQTAFVRLNLAAVILFFYVLISDKKLFRIKLRDLPLLAAIGVLSLLLMSCFYFTTITLTTMSTAVILLYTSPVIVMILSVIFLKEKLSAIKIAAIILAVSGCVLVAGIGDAKLTSVGLLTGLGSALAYSLYSILGTFALKKHKPFTITFYAFLFAALGSYFVASPVSIITTIAEKDSLWRLCICLITAVFSAVAPYVLFTFGLRYTEASKAAVIACVEPLVASLIGLIFYDESISVFGVVLILGAVVLLNAPDLLKNTEKTPRT